ncbi:hypothetical protein MKZ38_003268 [Zalerion maritima]|uniref:Uncharacterized protein n=1 Tax=Zalerion maritima TaxID=339359 RepID=A0AAD5RPH3_9PEZI|nr:hypothetical protein MKZ38_003268 [Zalerion maritima]
MWTRGQGTKASSQRDEAGGSLYPPPTHSDIDTPSQLVSSFASPSVCSNPAEPDVDTCLAHLKLLFAFQTLKDDIGNQDGLFGIWEGRCNDVEVTKNEDGTEERTTKPAQPFKVKEKRWALFVARAADRFETWWSKALPRFEEDVRQLNEEDLVEGSLSSFPSTGNIVPWKAKDLPPLDVLMILHSYMLNPRDFLEDCARFNYKNIWATSMPWSVVNAAIDTSFSYCPGPDAEDNFTLRAGRPWDSLEVPPTKRVTCPCCGEGSDRPWTTSTLIGSGCSDGGFSYICASCGLYIDCDVLRVAKFKRDVQNLLGPNNFALPGTILELKTNSPNAVPKEKIDTFEQTFPARLVKTALRSQVLALIQPNDTLKPTMEMIKPMVEKIFTNEKLSAEIDNKTSIMHSYRIPGLSRCYTRRMLSRYLDNHSPFALDLAAAAIRQGVFTEKMAKINWLHSPNSRTTIEKCILKYTRFVKIMAEHRDRLAVPTLDVDLAWHTHQLSPASYYVYTVSKTKRFLDHDDKVRDETLGEAFEFTSEAYQDMFKEVYSECTCWYCEAVRANQRINEAFRESAPASAKNSETASHVSNHHAARVEEDAVSALRTSARVGALHRKMLDEAYQKACKRAKKKGRPAPEKETHHDHWGATFAMNTPFVYPIMAYPGLYAGGRDPGTGYGGDSQTGSCAMGTCGVGPKKRGLRGIWKLWREC